VGLGILALVVTAGGLLCWTFFGPSVSDLTYVPGDGEVVAFVRVADLWKTDTVQNALQRARERDPTLPDPGGQLQEWLGLPPAEIERLILVAADTDKDLFWVLVSTSSPYDRNRVAGALKEPFPYHHEGKEFLLGTLRQDLLLGTFRNGQGIAVHYAGKQLLLVGSPAGVKYALNYAAGNRSKGPIDEGTQRAKEKHPIVLSFGAPLEQPLKVASRMRGLFPSDSKALLAAVSGTLVLDFGPKIELEAELKFSNSAEALAGRTNIERLIALGKTGISNLRLKMAGPEGLKLADPFESALDSLRLKLHEDTLTLEARVDADALARGLALLAPTIRKILLGSSTGATRQQRNLERIGQALLAHAPCPTTSVIPSPESSSPLLRPQRAGDGDEPAPSARGGRSPCVWNSRYRYGHRTVAPCRSTERGTRPGDRPGDSGCRADARRT
jgi:hypothetical protein